MPTLDDVMEMARDRQYLAMVATVRKNLTVQASMVNAGALPHPADGTPVLAYVTYGPVKLANLRARPQTTVSYQSGWHWATVEGQAELAGPEDGPPWLTKAEQLPQLLRDIFTAAGGTHDDWAEFDRAMAEQGRTAVLIRPDRVYGNLG